jgi:hypothetical protein
LISLAQGERGASKPYLRGKIWWIRNLVPGETKERRESSNSTNKNDAIRLLNSRRKEIDDGRMVPAAVTIANLLDLYLADKKSKKSGYRDAEIYVPLHLRPAFGRTQPRDFTTRLISNFVEQKKSLGRANASINRWLEALHRAFTPGYQNRPRLVPEIPQIPMLDETDNVREGLFSHADYVKVAGRTACTPAPPAGDWLSPRNAFRRDACAPMGSGRLEFQPDSPGKATNQDQTGAQRTAIWRAPGLAGDGI